MRFKSSDLKEKINKETAVGLNSLTGEDRLDFSAIKGSPPPDESIAWMLSTDNFSTPSVEYATIRASVDSVGASNPIVVSGTLPFDTYSVTSGSLPSEFTLDSVTGVISYATTNQGSSGSFGITASNKKGAGSEHLVNWEIRQSKGVSEFTNSENIYPFMYISTSKSTDNQPMVKQNFHGRTTSAYSGVIIEDPAYPIYTQYNGDGTWNYLIFPTGFTYWLLFVDSTTDPSTIAEGVNTDLFYGQLSTDFVSPSSSDVYVNSVNYPSDRADIHYGTGLSYIDFGKDASLDDFLTTSGSWSYGFKLVDKWVDDGLGRCMFSRYARNWQGVALGHSSTYSELIYGNGASINYSSSEKATLPSGGFAAGSFIRVTYDGSRLKFYVDGTLYYEKSGINSYMDDSSANALDLNFGRGAMSDSYQSNSSLSHGLWQGKIERLWISNGVNEMTDDTGLSYPASVTHSWDLSEQTGSNFAASSGAVSGQGKSIGM